MILDQFISRDKTGSQILYLPLRNVYPLSRTIKVAEGPTRGGRKNAGRKKIGAYFSTVLQSSPHVIV